MVTVFKQLNLGAFINDLISDVIIYSMGALFVKDTSLYTWRVYILDPGELWSQTQIKIKQWSCLKPEKCFWYLLDYTCTDGKWSYTDSVPRELLITNPNGSKIPIKQEEVQNPRRCSEFMTHLREEMRPPYKHQGQSNTMSQQNEEWPSTQPHCVGSIHA
jgi:hypothetical protein